MLPRRMRQIKERLENQLQSQLSREERELLRELRLIDADQRLEPLIEQIKNSDVAEHERMLGPSPQTCPCCGR